MYECHITLFGNRKETEEKVKSLKLDGWHFSAIDGDPDLGDGVKCYLTKHYGAEYGCDKVISYLDSMADYIAGHGLGSIRRKVEVIIYDKRY